MARRSWLGLSCALLALSYSPAAQAQSGELRVAVYAPWSGPPTADERFAFAMRLEDALEQAELGPVSVASYAKARDFQRAIASGKADVALVDAGATPSLPKRFAVVASWSSGERWVLAATRALTSLRNKRLALQAADATTSARMITTLLRGQTSATYWSRTVGAPVTEDARQLVLRDRADVVAVPERLAAEMTTVATLGTFSELSLATAGDAPRVTRARAVVRAVVRDAFGGSWSDGGPRLPAPVGPTRLLATRVPSAGPKLLDLLAPVESSLPELPIDELWMEPDAP